MFEKLKIFLNKILKKDKTLELSEKNEIFEINEEQMKSDNGIKKDISIENSEIKTISSKSSKEENKPIKKDETKDIFFNKYNNVKSGNIQLNELSDDDLLKVLFMSKEELDMKTKVLNKLEKETPIVN